MFKKLTKEFWAWAYAQGIPSRQPRGDPANRVRAKRIRELQMQWYALHKEVSHGIAE